MPKTILITGATDGIGALTAEKLTKAGHRVLVHGRNKAKLDRIATRTGATPYRADLALRSDVEAFAANVLRDQTSLDVLINNAGVLKTSTTHTADGLDVRFVVNTLAPYRLTRLLLGIIPAEGRIINLSSAAQAPVSTKAMTEGGALGDMDAYSQSKLAITIWTQEMARELGSGPIVVSVNPGSLLATKMVQEGFGIAGNDLNIGADILVKAALDDSFQDKTGRYFDNDEGRFAPPNPAASKADHVVAVMQAIETALGRWRT